MLTTVTVGDLLALYDLNEGPILGSTMLIQQYRQRTQRLVRARQIRPVDRTRLMGIVAQAHIDAPLILYATAGTRSGHSAAAGSSSKPDMWLSATLATGVQRCFAGVSLDAWRDKIRSTRHPHNSPATNCVRWSGPGFEISTRLGPRLENVPHGALYF